MPLASDDRTLRVWDLESEQTVHALHGHTGRVTAVAITPDARRAISGSTDRTLRVWNLETGQILGTLRGHTDTVHVVAISPTDAAPCRHRMTTPYDYGT